MSGTGELRAENAARFCGKGRAELVAEKDDTIAEKDDVIGEKEKEKEITAEGRGRRSESEVGKRK